MDRNVRIGGIRPGLTPAPSRPPTDRIADATRLANEIARLRTENKGLARALVLCAAAVANDAAFSELAPAELTEHNVAAVLANPAALDAADEFATRSGLAPGRVRHIIGLSTPQTGHKRPERSDPGR